MNKTETSQILGKYYPKENIKYSYTGEKLLAEEINEKIKQGNFTSYP